MELMRAQYGIRQNDYLDLREIRRQQCPCHQRVRVDDGDVVVSPCEVGDAPSTMAGISGRTYLPSGSLGWLPNVQYLELHGFKS